MAERPQGLSLLSVVISLLILQYSFADEPAGILDQCKESCERSYPLHTYPKEEPLLACKQGCRFSAISQLKARVSDVGENFTLACIAGCQESYEVEENRYACVAGCKLQDQIPSPESYVEESMPDQWSFRTYMVYVYPVLDVSKYCHGFLNRVGYYYRMSTSYYYTYGDGDSIIVEVQEQPQEFISVPKFDEVDFVENDEADSSYSDDSVDSYSGAVVQKGRQWLQCVSQRSGLPFWFLTSTLFLSIFFLMWLCCATATTATKQKSKAAVVGELLFLDDDSLLEKMPLVKEDEKDDAGPLPVKVHIDATTL
ncbi:transmembrane protein 59-like isoform X4 [Orbicella faveolata]|uniref:transmembrane protein 59-like isoform X1 n=1 Tax=Orbicella faveolata TaxID=48498 RepID=UPI0009E4421C|nr:transmembrane protein 59-like isoform X1 [Orbicella faveolata]XP_020624223.1 transmembrane protein 59-like isoform X4 [Orbicella faveolata]